MVLFDANLKAFRLENYIRTRTTNRIKSVECTPFHSNHSLLDLPDDQHLSTLAHKVDSHKLSAKPWALMVWSVLVWGKFPWAGSVGGEWERRQKRQDQKKIMDPIALDRWLKRNLNELNNA